MSVTRNPEEALSSLRAPFAEGSIGKLPRRGPDGKTMYLDYVGHAAVTDRLLDADPTWHWEPLSLNEAGLPRIVEDTTGQLALWIRLEVLGVSRIGVGTARANAIDPLKQLISDALRNAAMRFGVALDLWSKEGLAGAESESKPLPAPDPIPLTEDQRGTILRLAETKNVPLLELLRAGGFNALSEVPTERGDNLISYLKGLVDA